MADPAVLRKKTDDLARKRFSQRTDLPRIYEKILSRDTKLLFEGLFLGVLRLLSFVFRYLLFFF